MNWGSVGSWGGMGWGGMNWGSVGSWSGVPEHGCKN